MKVFMVDGEQIELYTIGETAKLIGKKVGTIRKWERDGLFATRYRDERGHRLFRIEQINVIRTAVKTKQGISMTDEMKQELKKASKM